MNRELLRKIDAVEASFGMRAQTARRQTLHLARATDAQIEVHRLERESDLHYEKRCAAISALGDRWCRHPAYASPARHSIHESVWKPARAEYLAQVAAAAAADRARNPAHRQWERVRAVMGDQ